MRRIAHQRLRAPGWWRPAPDLLDPGVGQPVGRPQEPDVVAGARVSGVRVAHHDDGVAGRVPDDEPGELDDVVPPRRQVGVGGPGVGVQVVEVDVHALGQPHA